MNNDLKQNVQRLVDSGYTQEEILTEFGNNVSQSTKHFQTTKRDKLSRKEKDIVSKTLIFLTSFVFTGLIALLLISGVIYLVDIKSDDVYLFLVLTISILFSIFISYKLVKKVNYANSFERIIELGLLPYLAELILPATFSFLLFIFAENGNIDNFEEVTFTISIIFFAIVILEWIRRFKDKTTQSYIKYIYIIVLILLFALGLWYVSELAKY